MRDNDEKGDAIKFATDPTEFEEGVAPKTGNGKGAYPETNSLDDATPRLHKTNTYNNPDYYGYDLWVVGEKNIVPIPDKAHDALGPKNIKAYYYDTATLVDVVFGDHYSTARRIDVVGN